MKPHGDVSIGTDYRIADDWLLQSGVMFDISAFRNEDRMTAIPIDRQIRFSIGAQHEVGESLTLGGPFTSVNRGQAKVCSTSVRGDDQDDDLFIVGLTLAFDRLPWG